MTRQLKFVCHQPVAIRAMFNKGDSKSNIINTYKTYEQQGVITIYLNEGWGISAAVIDPLVSGFW